MKDRIKKYVDNLFEDIYDTKQLRELKEEISANLLEKINDFAENCSSEDEAFKKAVSSLGDMSELIESLKKASNEKQIETMNNDMNIDKKHIIAYIIASAILLFGAMTTGIVYLQSKNMTAALGTSMPFLLVSGELFLYFGLTQEFSDMYGMKPKRALLYCLGAGISVFGLYIAGFVYFTGNELFAVVGSLMPFVIPSAIIFIYLGLTEKDRRKMNSAWQNQWVEYYSNPQAMMVRGNISGALWIFSFAAFLLIGFAISFKYSWIVFIFAVGCETLIEAYFSSKKKK